MGILIEAGWMFYYLLLFCCLIAPFIGCSSSDSEAEFASTQGGSYEIGISDIESIISAIDSSTMGAVSRYRLVNNNYLDSIPMSFFPHLNKMIIYVNKEVVSLTPLFLFNHLEVNNLDQIFYESTYALGIGKCELLDKEAEESIAYLINQLNNATSGDSNASLDVFQNETTYFLRHLVIIVKY